MWNYPEGVLFTQILPEPSSLKWYRFNTNYWAIETGYIELNTNRNHPVEAGMQIDLGLE